MDNILSIALASLHQDMIRLDNVAFNLTNASTPGFKRQVTVSRPFQQLVQDGVSPLGGKEEVLALVPTMPMEVALDLRPGSLKLTGEPLDFALTGNGYFEVQTPTGPAYTRQGNFHTDAMGRLVTAQGLPVAGLSGDIFLNSQAPQVDGFGRIFEPKSAQGMAAAPPNHPLSQIKVVHFEDTAQMRHLGEGLLSAGINPTASTAGAGELKQGALENANISTSKEMVELIQTMRHFESIQKITQGYHEMIGTAIQRLGD